MVVCRYLVRLAAIGPVVVGATLATAVVAPAASAHGALSDPVSRAAACAAEARAARPRACAGLPGGGRLDWDNVRVAGAAGNDRGAVPDGALCSGGLRAYRTLDEPGAGWPATRVVGGAPLTFSYRATIPHRGTFRIYLTGEGYDPTRRLRWGDLDPVPLLAVTDPPLRGGSYRMAATLPADRTGRHVVYTIWQNSDTPDTYYSCSDVVFIGRVPSGAPSTPSSETPSAGATPAGPGAVAGAANAAPQLPVAVPVAATGPRALPLGLLGGGTLIVLSVAMAVVAFRRSRAT